MVKHFKYSGKSKEILDNSMNALEMGSVHLLNWCATRMAHFVVACQRFDELLIPVYNAMYTLDLKKEERDKLFQSSNIYTMKLISNLHGLMHNKLQRKCDKDDHLASETFMLAQETASNVRSVITPKADKFVQSLHFDGNGNLMFIEVLSENDHLLRLSDSHKPNRFITEQDRLDSIKNNMKKIKAEVLKNIYDNINDQVSDGTYYFNWSGLDLADKGSTIQDRLDKLDPLIQLFTTDRTHKVQSYKDAKETKTIPTKWKGYGIYLHYPPALSCSDKDLKSEIQSSWPSVGKLYQKCYQELRGKPSQREVWRKFLHSPNSGIMCSLIQILLATPSNTSALERSYSSLEMISAPRRNPLNPEHLELLYLLKALKLPVKSSAEYADAVELLSV